jgi:hypothetical protein
MRSTPATLSGTGVPAARSAQTTDIPSATMRLPEQHELRSSASCCIMQRCEALAVMTVWLVLGPRHHSKHRATASSMRTRSKVSPNSSAGAELFTVDSLRGRALRGSHFPDLFLSRVQLRGRGPLAHPQARVLVASEKAPKLDVIIAGNALQCA